jgi:hypothetical protein
MGKRQAMNNPILLSTILEFATAHALVIALGAICVISLIRIAVVESRPLHRSSIPATGKRPIK